MIGSNDLLLYLSWTDANLIKHTFLLVVLHDQVDNEGSRLLTR